MLNTILIKLSIRGVQSHVSNGGVVVDTSNCSNSTAMSTQELDPAHEDFGSSVEFQK